MWEIKMGKAKGRFTPERVAMIVSTDQKGKANIIPIGWKMRAASDPPKVAIAIGKKSYSHEQISREREFVFAVPGEDICDAVIYCGYHSGRDVDKFKETGLTPLPAKFVKAPLIKECTMNLECKVVGQLDAGDHTIFLGEILTTWVSEERKRNLLCIGQEKGYECLGQWKETRLGVVRD